MSDDVKRQMIENYLRQQESSSVSSGNSSALVVYDIPENISLEEFKNFVKKWLEYDNYIKKAREVIREKRKARDKLTEIITKFMCKYNIEDLNTKEGRIRCRTQVVKAPMSQKVVKQKITDYITDEGQKNEILHKIYDEREKVEKVSLRRLKIS